MDYLAIDIFSDSDWADELHRRSRGGYLIYANNQLLDWRSWIQPTISLSSTEAELIAASEAMTQYRYIALILADLKLCPTAVMLYNDNEAAIKNIVDRIACRKTKHLDIKTKILNDFYEDGLFDVKWIPSEDNPADALTKMAKQSVFEKHRARMFFDTNK